MRLTETAASSPIVPGSGTAADVAAAVTVTPSTRTNALLPLPVARRFRYSLALVAVKLKVSYCQSLNPPDGFVRVAVVRDALDPKLACSSALDAPVELVGWAIAHAKATSY